MITVDAKAELNYKNLCSWIELWEKGRNRLKTLGDMYENRDRSKPETNHVVKMPFAKKLVQTASAAAVGDGVTLTAPKLEGAEKATFEEIKRLFSAQTIMSQDRKVIKDGCKFGIGYELVYLSNDKVPIPKTSKVSAENAFVVFDNTVEHNSLYGVRYQRYTKNDADWLAVTVYDNTHMYESDVLFTSALKASESALAEKNPHHLGRVPLTEYHNCEEEQSDFEQVIPLILDRSEVHDLNLKDFKKIAKNYLKSRNIELVGKTDEEKNETRDKMADNQRIEVNTADNYGTPPDSADDITILSKNENYSSIDVFGKDIDSKIYDLSMIPNLSDEQFAGNQSGVALDIKLMPFKRLIEDKDEEIIKLYKRRIKMYMTALNKRSPAEFALFDISSVDVLINRDWTKVLTEIASIIAQLHPTGLFSDRFLTNLYPKADYDDIAEQKAKEADEKRKQQALNPDPMNQSTEWLASLLNGNGNPAAPKPEEPKEEAPGGAV